MYDSWWPAPVSSFSFFNKQTKEKSSIQKKQASKQESDEGKIRDYIN